MVIRTKTVTQLGWRMVGPGGSKKAEKVLCASYIDTGGGQEHGKTQELVWVSDLLKTYLF